MTRLWGDLWHFVCCLGVRVGSEQLLREAQAYSHIHHSNVAQLFELPQYWDSYAQFYRPVLVMELIDGEPLSEYLQDIHAGTLKEPLDLDILLAAIMDALAYCHQEGVFHGDLHSGNILITKKLPKPVLIDFSVSDFEVLSVHTGDAKQISTLSGIL